MNLYRKIRQLIVGGEVVCALPSPTQPEPPHGNLDACRDGRVTGWAWNPASAQDKPIVEILAAGVSLGFARADQFREDLARHGIGNGCHGFTFDASGKIHGGESISVRFVDGTELAGSPMLHTGSNGEGRYVVFADIADNCNLRCPFCLTDYSRHGKTSYMSRETFARFIELMPYVRDGGFMLSCVHEPTLHPELPEFLAMIPPAYRHKAMLTTNLAREKFPDRLIQALANSGLHHINISFDSLDPDTFAIMRKNGRFSTFRDNLERLVELVRASDTPPALRYITVLTHLNAGEIGEIVRVTSEKYLSSENEVREPQIVAHMPAEWKTEHMPSSADWATATAAIGALGNTVKVCYEKYPALRGNLDEVGETRISGWAINERHPETPLEVEIRRDGMLLARVRADQHRPDLQAAGIGNGLHGFSVTDLPSGDPNGLEIHAHGVCLATARKAAPAPAHPCPPDYPLSLYVYPDGRLEMLGRQGFQANLHLIRDIPAFLQSL